MGSPSFCVVSFFFLYLKSSALRGGERRCSFLSNQKGTKESPGAASGERLRAAGAHSHCPRTPGYGERPPVFLGTFIRRASSSQSPLYSGRPSMGIRHAAPLLLLPPPNPLRWASAGTPIMRFFLPREHRPLPGQKFRSIRAVRTPPSLAEPRWLGSCWRQSDHRRTKQAGTHQAVCVRI